MIGSVLVCIDAPKAPDVPLRHAIDFARWHGARLELAAFVEDRLDEVGRAGVFGEGGRGGAFDEAGRTGLLDEELAATAEPAVEEADVVEEDPLVVRAGELCAEAGLAWRSTTLEGDRLERIAHEGKTVDLVVLSRQEALRGAWVGGFPDALRVLEQTGRAVLVAGTTYQRPAGLIALYDAEPHSARALSGAVESAALSGLPLTVIASSPRSEEATILARRARRYAAGRGVPAECRAREAEPRREVRTALADRRGLVLVAGVGFPTPIGRLTRRPLAAELLGDVDGPVLLMA
jgi:hypothetical protein